MTINNVHYYAVTDGKNTNFYRLKIAADTKLGVAGYREGWFSATAVDQLFGNVSESGSESSLERKDTVRKAYENAVVQATQNYLTLALDPKTPPQDLEQAFEIRQRVLLFPNTSPQIFSGSEEIAYNPDRGVAIPHSDEKLVIILSSDPDGVVSGIANIAEDEKTVLAINNLSKIVSQRTRNDLAASTARSDVQKQQLYSLRQSIENIRKNSPSIPASGSIDEPKATLRTEILTLQNMLDDIAP